MRRTRNALMPLLVAAAAGQAIGQSVAQNDIAVGWSQSNLDNTIQLFSAPTGSPPVSTLKTDPWNQFGFIEFVAWDNAGGVQHNPNGHLIGLDFGTTAGGLQLFYYPSGTGSGTATALFNSGSAPAWANYPNLILSRGGGVAVSPDNTKIAVGAYELGQVIVFGYDAAVGAITSASETTDIPTPFNGGRTPGIGWFTSTQAMVFSPDGRLSTVDVSNPSLPVTVQVTVPTPNLGTSESASVAYIQQVSPYIFVSYSAFSTAAGTTNKLYAIDPRTTPWSVAAQMDLSTSANTLRGIALDSNGNLFLTQYAGTAAPAGNPTVQEIVGASNLASWHDNSSVVVYTDAAGAFHANFGYLDVAAGVGGTTPPSCYANCDGSTSVPFLNVNDFICFQSQFAAGTTYANCDNSTTPPVLNVNDFICFQSRFAAGCSAP